MKNEVNLSILFITLLAMILGFEIVAGVGLFGIILGNLKIKRDNV